MATEPLQQIPQPGACEQVDESTDPHWRRTLWAVWLAHLLAAVGFSFVMPFLPLFVRDLGVADERMVSSYSGVAMFAAGLSLTIFQPIWGSLADRYGRKLMLQRAMFGGAIAIALMGLSQTIWQLVLFRFLQGALTGTGSACNTMVASVTPRKHLGAAMGLLQTALIVGNAAGPWMGGVVADTYGYRIPFYVCGVLWAISGFVVLFFTTEQRVRPEQRANGNHGLREVFGGGGLTALLSAFFLSAFAMTFVGPIFPLFVEQIAQTDRAATITGQLMAVGGIASGLACIIVGRLADRIGHRRVLVVANAGSAFFSIPHAFAQSLGQLFGLRVGWGLIAGGGGPAMNAMIGASVSSDTLGRTFGITTSAMCLGFALGPLVGGFMATGMGMRLPFIVMGILQLICALLIALYVRPNAHKQSEPETPELVEEPSAAK